LEWLEAYGKERGFWYGRHTAVRYGLNTPRRYFTPLDRKARREFY
jgi:hypothetical protein